MKCNSSASSRTTEAHTPTATVVQSQRGKINKLRDTMVLMPRASREGARERKERDNRSEHRRGEEIWVARKNKGHRKRRKITKHEMKLHVIHKCLK
jgi:hypothetical protein